MQFLTTTSEGYISLFFTLALMLVLLLSLIHISLPEADGSRQLPSPVHSWRTSPEWGSLHRTKHLPRCV